MTEAVKDKPASEGKASEKPGMTAFSKLRSLRKETKQINNTIESEFEQIKPEDLQ